MSFGTKGCMYCEGECNKECLPKQENKQETLSDVIVSCPKCNSSWIGDIGYDNCECWMCGNVFKLKSKTGLEDRDNKAKRMYSEEDLRQAYTVGKHGGVNQTYYDFDEWFEQFKKK